MARFNIENWLNIDLASLTNSNKEELIQELATNRYRNFLQQKYMISDYEVRMRKFKSRITRIMDNIPSYSNSITGYEVFGNTFFQIIQLCEGKEQETFDITDTKINNELSKIEKNIEILNLLEDKNYERIRELIYTKCGLSNAYRLCNNIIINNQKLSKLLKENTVIDESNIINIITDRIPDLKNEAKSRILKVIESYLQQNLSEIHKIFNKNSDSIHLTTSIGGFSVELTLKLLYSLSNIDSLSEKYYLQILETSLNRSSALVNLVLNQEWKRIIDNNKELFINELNNFKRSVNSNIAPSVINGHTLFASLSAISDNEIKTFIKYKLMTINSMIETRLTDIVDKKMYVTAEDIMILFRDFSPSDASEQLKKIKADMIANSNVFDGQRYNLEELKDPNLRFIYSFALVSYIALNYEYNRKKQPEKIVPVPPEFSVFQNIYSEKLHKLITTNPQKREVLSKMCNNLSLEEQKKIISYLNQTSFYELINYFSYNEIKELLITVKNNDIIQEKTSFKEIVYYAVFLKTYINEILLNLDSSKFTRINELFKVIRNTNDFTMIGHQFSKWFYSIKIEELTTAEFEIIDKIDPEYIRNCLNYKNKIIYEKCKVKNIKFSYLYARFFDKFDTIIESLPKDFTGEIPGRYLYICDYLNRGISKYEYEMNTELSIKTKLSHNEILDLLYKYNLTKEEILHFIEIEKSTQMPISIIVDLYKISIKEVNHLKKIRQILSQTDLSISSLLELYKHNITEENTMEISEILNATDLSSSDIIEFYEYGIYDVATIKKILELSNEIGIDYFETIELYKNGICDIASINKILKLEVATGLSISDIIASYKNGICDITTINEILDLSNETWLSYQEIIELYKNGISKTTINSLHAIAKKKIFSLREIIELYKSGIQDEIIINRIIELSNKTKMTSQEILRLYKNGIQNDTKIKKIPKMVNHTNFNVYEITDLYIIGLTEQQIIDLSNLLKKFKANSNMKTNDIKDLGKIIKLLGNHGDYIFYKTYDEVNNFLKQCPIKIKFNPEWLKLSSDEINKQILNAKRNLFEIETGIDEDERAKIAQNFNLQSSELINKYCDGKITLEQIKNMEVSNKIIDKINGLIEKGVSSNELFDIITPQIINQAKNSSKK